jgi:hypothetical protein
VHVTNAAQAILLGTGAAAGILLAYVDSLPTWDDTGVLIGALVVASGLLTLLGCRRPWLVALVVGIWIPLHDIYTGHDIRMLVVLLFALFGGYAGWVVRLGISKTLHMT